MEGEGLIIQGDALTTLKTLPDESAQCCVTSPPYWGLRDYGVEGQLGLERTPEEYVAKMLEVFREVRRVLRKDGTLWLNLGDSYAGSGQGWGHNGKVYAGPKQSTNRGTLGRTDFVYSRPPGYLSSKDSSSGLKPKDLCGIPWRVAFALQADGWYLRSDIIWAKPNPMPESVTDRPTKAHEYVFLMSKSERYFYDQDSIREPFQGKDERRWAGSYEQDGSILHETTNAGIKRTKRYPKTPGQNSREFVDRDPTHLRYGSGNKERKLAAGEVGQRINDHLGSSVPWQDNGNGRNLRSVWTVATVSYPGAHFATFPYELAERCIKAGTKEGDTVLDPFSGAGTVGVVCKKLQREFIGIELKPEYVEMAEKRIERECGGLFA